MTDQLGFARGTSLAYGHSSYEVRRPLFEPEDSRHQSRTEPRDKCLGYEDNRDNSKVS